MIRERKHIRLKGYDYSQPGEYFVTICTKGQKHLFGEVVNGEMNVNSIGETAMECWSRLPAHFPNVELDEFVVMPNHFHGIVRIMDNPVGAQKTRPAEKRLDNSRRDVQLNIPTDNYHSKISPKAGSLAVIVRTYKAAVTTICRKDGIEGFGWQSGFYEQIIRDDRSLTRIRQYIANNPQRWHLDAENPNRQWENGFEQPLLSSERRSTFRAS